MRHPRVLDVMRAVKALSTGHRDVDAWWYAPPPRLHVAGERSTGASSKPRIELVVEGRPFAPSELEAMARELSILLGWASVAVRAHRGDAEDQHLFRLLSHAGGAAKTGEVPEHERTRLDDG